MIEDPFDIGANTFDYESYTIAKLFVPAGTGDKYKAKEGWKKFDNIIDPLWATVTDIEREVAKELNRYTLDGRAIKNVHKGINIIRMNDRSVKKVVAK